MLLLGAGCNIVVQQPGVEQREQPIKNEVQTQTDKTTETQTVKKSDSQLTSNDPSIYTNAEMGFRLKVPAQWVTYKYYVTYYPGSSTFDGNERVRFAANFSEWGNFVMLTVGKAPKSVWEKEKMDEGSMTYPAIHKITESNGYVYFWDNYTQDIPRDYDQSLPHFPADFELIR